MNQGPSWLFTKTNYRCYIGHFTLHFGRTGKNNARVCTGIARVAILVLPINCGLGVSCPWRYCASATQRDIVSPQIPRFPGAVRVCDHSQPTRMFFSFLSSLIAPVACLLLPINYGLSRPIGSNSRKNATRTIIWNGLLGCGWSYINAKPAWNQQQRTRNSGSLSYPIQYAVCC